MGIKRQLADMVERTTGVKIRRPRHIGHAFEEDHLKRFFSLFRVDCVFDVGANAGQYVELLRDHVGFKGPIISFEPIPDMVEFLQRKAKRDGNWHVEPVALAETAGETAFNVMAMSQFSSFLSPKNDECGEFNNENKVVRSIPVKTSTLKIEYLKYKQKLGFSRPFLKMDTQGNDLVVARSAEEAITEFVGLQSELAAKRLYKDSPYFQETVAFYQSKGFELSAFVPNHPWHFPYLVEFDCIMLRPDALPQ